MPKKLIYYVVISLFEEKGVWKHLAIYTRADSESEARRIGEKYFKSIGREMRFGAVVGPDVRQFEPTEESAMPKRKSSKFDGFVIKGEIEYSKESFPETDNPYLMLRHIKRAWDNCMEFL